MGRSEGNSKLHRSMETGSKLPDGNIVIASTYAHFSNSMLLCTNPDKYFWHWYTDVLLPNPIGSDTEWINTHFERLSQAM